ncbi:Peptidase family M23 [Robiginitalea myxolifaciens]|uniref:Peptidase family M23 n=1 Tax=Robiginitalea myxolifaciens TaxID=400055 RepID=A0A1I6H6P2_9FLAO|nr:M23 family metallopeptidase [Robiginitalea myxolifaciens]SFR50054.1 Peptidase family M23 [Robiginitalea myxolifaciens]
MPQLYNMMRLVALVLFFCSQLTFAQVQPQDTDFRSPVDIPLILAGTFGELRSNHFHAGLDIKTQQRQGLPVYAIADGTVSRIKISHWGYGKVLYVAHPNGYTSVYAHLQKFSPEIEAYIRKLQYEKRSYEIEVFPDYGTLPLNKGELIAYSGNTGGSSGPHLHFEIRNSANERPQNPLLFGMEVRDATNPTLVDAYAYPLSPDAQVNGSASRIEIAFSRQADGTYLSDTLQASGRLGFGVKAYDRQDLAANHNGVYRVIQRVNGTPYTDLVFNGYSFTEDRQINTLIDYPYYARHNSRILKCFKDSGNRLSLYENDYQDGMVTIRPGSQSLVEIELSDQAGNATLLRIPVTGKVLPVQNPKPEVQSAYFIRASKPSSFDLGKVKVYFPAESFYEDTSLDLQVDGDNFKIHEANIPLHRNYTLTFEVDDIPEAERASTFIARLDGRGRPQYARTFRRGNTFTTRTRNLGTYTLAQDTVPPKIKPRNFKAGQWLTNYRYLSLTISDDLSGISSYSATINGRWVLMEYEPKLRTITYTFDDKIGEDRQSKLEVVVTDNCGNKSTYEATIFRR